MNPSARRPPLRLVQLGMGGWGRDWIAVTAVESAVEVVGYVDPSAKARTVTIRIGAHRPGCSRTSTRRSEVQQVIVNAARWAAPGTGPQPIFGNRPPLEER